jgi:hypothetical protein
MDLNNQISCKVAQYCPLHCILKKEKNANAYTKYFRVILIQPDTGRLRE